jgi:glycosyltransferase involved in cell wall biosynthesis
MEGPIRILQILAQRPSGGIESYLLNMHRNIDIKKIQFDYIICDSVPAGEFDQKIKKLGGKVYILSPLKYRNLFLYIKEMNKFFKTHPEYKIVHGHFTGLASIYLSIAKIHGVKYRLVHSHSINYSDYWIRAFRNFLFQLPLKYIANYYVACTKKAGLFLFGKKTIEQNKVFISNNAIEAKDFRFNKSKRLEIRKALNLENKFVIGHIGRMCHAKNHNFLIDTFAEISKKNENSILMLIGSGELEEDIKKKVSKLNLENKVLFMGYRKDTFDLLQAIDIFVLPSRYEGLGIAAIEAQAAGLISIVSSNVPEEVKITNLVHYMPADDGPEEWAGKILGFYEHSRRDMYKEILNSGYDVKTEVKRLENMYLKILGPDLD